MAQVEFTQQWKYPVSAAGQITPPIYEQLQTEPGVCIVKSLSCYSTSGIQNTGGTPTIDFLNANSPSPSSFYYIYAEKNTRIANSVATICTPDKQVILTLPYIAFNANMAGAGDFVFQISYSFIPLSNALSANFKSAYHTLSSGATGASLVGISSAVATIVKSITFLNFDINGNSTTVTLLITTPTNPVATMFAAPIVVSSGFSASYALPIYLNSNTTITVQNAGPAAVSVLYSYTQDPTSA